MVDEMLDAHAMGQGPMNHAHGTVLMSHLFNVYGQTSRQGRRQEN